MLSQLKHKRVAKESEKAAQFKPPSVIEWLTTDQVVQLEKIWSTHRYEYKYVSPEFDKRGQPSTTFGKALLLTEEDIKRIERQFYSRVYYDQSTGK